MPRFFVELAPAPWKVGNAAHFINVERRLKAQVAYIRGLRDERNFFEAGPFAILNRAAASTAFVVSTESWESLSRVLHADPMAVYQAPQISYLADWEEAMGKHADTIGSDEGLRSLVQDVRIDLGQDLPG